MLAVLLSSLFFSVFAQKEYQKHWEIQDDRAIVWDLKNDQNLPHSDNIEMAGTKVAGIIHYEIDTAKNLKIEREIIWPQLHPYPKETDPWWAAYRSYLRETFDDGILPQIIVNEQVFVPGKVKKVTIDGFLKFEHEVSKSGVVLERIFYPAKDTRNFYERWKLLNTTDSLVQIDIGNSGFINTAYGKEGGFQIFAFSNNKDEFRSVDVLPQQLIFFEINMSARIKEERLEDNGKFQNDYRSDFINQLTNSLILEIRIYFCFQIRSHPFPWWWTVLRGYLGE